MNNMMTQKQLVTIVAGMIYSNCNGDNTIDVETAAKLALDLCVAVEHEIGEPVDTNL